MGGQPVGPAAENTKGDARPAVPPLVLVYT